MSLNVGALERKVKEVAGGSNITAYMGLLAVSQVITGTIAIAAKSEVVGNTWPLEVKIRQDDEWATLGSAKFERKNDKANWYLRIVLESPIIQSKLGGPLWIRAFPAGEAKDDGKAPTGCEEYEMVWGSGGGKTKPANVPLDDEIPF